MNIIFSVVLYNHNFDFIKPLLESINELSLLTRPKGIEIKVFLTDNSKNIYLSKYELSKNFKNLNITYFKSPQNLGYGLGHNNNLLSIKNINKKDLYIITNPDIYFESNSLYEMILELNNRSDISCVAPLIVNEADEIQFSAKKNPTFLSLLIGRFKILLIFSFFKKYYENHINLDKNYRKDEIESTYLSGCFLIVKSETYHKIGGFSDMFFLHLEDADFSRRCSLIGKTIHLPIAKVTHKWARGSHKSIIQMFHLTKSLLVYSRIWGVKLF